MRTADRDDVVPLANPIYSKTGDMMTEIPIKAGQNVLVSVCAYNRCVRLALVCGARRPAHNALCIFNRAWRAAQLD